MSPKEDQFTASGIFSANIKVTQLLISNYSEIVA